MHPSKHSFISLRHLLFLFAASFALAVTILIALSSSATTLNPATDPNNPIFLENGT